MEVAWGVVGRTCRDVVARRKGEVLGSWVGKVCWCWHWLSVPGTGDSLLGHRGPWEGGGGGGGRGLEEVAGRAGGEGGCIEVALWMALGWPWLGPWLGLP